MGARGWRWCWSEWRRALTNTRVRADARTAPCAETFPAPASPSSATKTSTCTPSTPSATWPSAAAARGTPLSSTSTFCRPRARTRSCRSRPGRSTGASPQVRARTHTRARAVRTPHNRLPPRLGLVLPAFEVDDSVIANNLVPRDKPGIVEMARGDGQPLLQRQSQARPFQIRHYKDGHHATDYERWFKTKSVYRVGARDMRGHDCARTRTRTHTRTHTLTPHARAGEVRARVRALPHAQAAHHRVRRDLRRLRPEQGVARVRAVRRSLPAARVAHGVPRPPPPRQDHRRVRAGERGDRQRQGLHPRCAAALRRPLAPRCAHIPRTPCARTGWSCWRQFQDRVERDYGWRSRDPCWAAGYVLPKTNQKRGAYCVRNNYKRWMDRPDTRLLEPKE